MKLNPSERSTLLNLVTYRLLYLIDLPKTDPKKILELKTLRKKLLAFPAK